MLTPPGFNNGLDIMKVSGRVMSGPRKQFASTNAKLNGAARELVTVVFTKSEAWVCPWTTTQIESMRGYGSPGSPEAQYYQQRYKEDHVNTQYYYGGGTYSTTTTTYGFGEVPKNFCTPKLEPSPERNGTQSCYYYSDASFYETVPATYGQDATAFGFTFTRGYGGNSSWTNIDAVPFTVSPGETYNIIVPSGGYVTFSYYV